MQDKPPAQQRRFLMPQVWWDVAATSDAHPEALQVFRKMDGDRHLQAHKREEAIHDRMAERTKQNSLRAQPLR